MTRNGEPIVGGDVMIEPNIWANQAYSEVVLLPEAVCTVGIMRRRLVGAD